MLRLFSSLPLVLVGAVLALPHEPAAAQDDTYMVDMSRSYAVGDRLRMDAQASSERQVRRGGSTEVTRTTLTLVSEFEVLAVDARGLVTHARHVVEHFDGQAEDEALEPIPAGTAIEVSLQGEDTRYRAEGFRLREGHEQALDLLLKLHANSKPTEADYFGSDQPRTVGEHWPMNRAAAADALSKDKLTVAPADLEGGMTLESLSEIDGIPCFDIDGSMTIHNMEVDTPFLARVKSAQGRMTWGGAFPRQPDLPPLRSEKRFTFTVEASVLLGGINLSVTETRESSSRFEYLHVPRAEVSTGAGEQQDSEQQDGDDADDDEWKVISTS